MKLPKDILSNTYTKPRIFLCETDKTRVCQLETTNTKASLKFKAYSELSFDVGRVYVDSESGSTLVNPFYDKIEAVRLVELEGFGFFELQGPELTSDGIEEKKSCTAYSLEYTLSQKYLEDFYVNQGTTDSLEVLNAESEDKVVPITLYNNTNTKLSLLHLVLDEKIYGWSVGHVDLQLATMSRQFDIDRMSVYDFLVNEVCKKFNCYVVFDTINNKINIYAEYPTAKFIGDGTTTKFDITSHAFSSVETVSVDGAKITGWSYTISEGKQYVILENAPEVDADIEIIGIDTTWETDVYISFDNLSRDVNVDYDADEIKTMLTVTYGDDKDIREVNLGLPYIVDISYYCTPDWMGEDLYKRYEEYSVAVNEKKPYYTANMKSIQQINDKISYEKNRLSLEYSLAASVNAETVGTYYTRQKDGSGNYYYTAVTLPAEYKIGTKYYSNATTNVNETKVNNLYGILVEFFNAYNLSLFDDSKNTKSALDKLIKLNNADEEGVNPFDFVKDAFNKMHTDLSQLTYKKGDDQVKALDSAKTIVHTFLKEIWKELGKTPLDSLYLATYKGLQDNYAQSGWSEKSNDNYGTYFTSVVMIESINNAISTVDVKITELEAERTTIQNANMDISNSLAMDQWFNEKQLVRLSAFLREDELHIDDIVETSLDDLTSSYKLKQEAIESGRIELRQLSQPRLQFSMTMANIYALVEFEPIIHQFQLGNIIKIALRSDYCKQARLLQVDMNFDDFSDFSCEFGELTDLKDQSDIHADLLGQAISAGKSVAAYSGYWTQGADMATSTDLKIQQGLLDATTRIKAIDGTQGIVIDKYGIRLQKNIGNGEVDPTQIWMVNNMILLSDDGFKSSKSAFGEVYIPDDDDPTKTVKYYGLISELVLSGYIEGSKIKGGTIQIGERFDENGKRFYAFEVDRNGNVTMKGKTTIVGYPSKDDVDNAVDNAVKNITTNFDVEIGKISSQIVDLDRADDTLESKITQTAETIALEVARATGTEEELSSKITQTANEIKLEVNDVKDGLQSQISVNSDNIKLKVSKNGVVSAINQSAEEVKISASKITLEGTVTANNYFKIKTDGSMEATRGKIGGWTIDSTYIGNKVDDKGSFYITSADDPVNYWIRAQDSNNQLNFGVDRTGKLYANDATIIGNITATSLTLNGSISGLSYDDISGTPNLNVYISKGGVVGSTPTEGATGFKVSTSGVLTASNAVIYGSIFASDGKIGGWSIYPTYIGSTKDKGSFYITSVDDVIENSPVQYWMRAHYNNSMPFYVTREGKLFANNAEITGKITSTEGEIGGWKIEDWGIAKTATINGTSRTTGLQNPSSGAVAFAAGATDASNWSTAPFYVTRAGDVHAESGTIGGWQLVPSYYSCSLLYANKSTLGTGMAAPNEDGYIKWFPAFWAGYSGAYSNPYSSQDAAWAGTTTEDWTKKTSFYVTHGGALHATGAVISGSITATSGTIGDCTIDANGKLTVPAANISSLTVDKIQAGTNSNAVKFTNITATGGVIGGWKIRDNFLLGEGDTAGRKIYLYPDGRTFNVTANTTNVFFIVIYIGGSPYGGISTSGWQTIYNG